MNLQTLLVFYLFLGGFGATTDDAEITWFLFGVFISVLSVLFRLVFGIRILCFLFGFFICILSALYRYRYFVVISSAFYWYFIGIFIGILSVYIMTGFCLP